MPEGDALIRTFFQSPFSPNCTATQMSRGLNRVLKMKLLAQR